MIGWDDSLQNNPGVEWNNLNPPPAAAAIYTGLQGCMNRARCISWPEVVKGLPYQDLDSFVS